MQGFSHYKALCNVLDVQSVGDSVCALAIGLTGIAEDKTEIKEDFL